MTTTLSDRLLFLEARVALVEDKVGLIRRTLTAWGRSFMVGAGFALAAVVAYLLESFSTVMEGET